MTTQQPDDVKMNETKGILPLNLDPTMQSLTKLIPLVKYLNHSHTKPSTPKATLPTSITLLDELINAFQVIPLKNVQIRPCVCGTELQKAFVNEMYEYSSIPKNLDAFVCDECDIGIPYTLCDIVYYCPKNKDKQKHPFGGYCLCASCGISNIIKPTDINTKTIIKIQMLGFSQKDVLKAYKDMQMIATMTNNRYQSMLEYSIISILLNDNSIQLPPVNVCECGNMLKHGLMCESGETYYCFGCGTQFNGGEYVFYCSHQNPRYVKLRNGTLFYYCVWCAIYKTNKQNIIINNDQLKPQIICKMLCDNQHISNCDYSKQLTEMILYYKSHNSLRNEINITQILNSFIHFLEHHNNNDNDFEYVYNQIGQCDIVNCKSIERNYTKRNLNNNPGTDDLLKEIAHKQIIDTIHCHIQHSYDMGFRLTSSDRLSINQSIDDHDEKKSNCNPDDISLDNTRLFRKNRIINNIKKCRNFKQNMRSSRYMTSTLIQSKVNTDNIKSNYSSNDTDISLLSMSDMYSTGIDFRYWYRNRNYLYDIYPKYLSLKNELINNSLCSIHIKQFNIAYEKALIKKRSRYARSLVATPQIGNNDTNPYTRLRSWHINENSIISIQHILSMIVYCNFDVLQNIFSKTFRQNVYKQLPKVLKRRNSNFYYLSKYLMECVLIYGTTSNIRSCKQYYHGINKELYFYSTIAMFNGPLSTSSCLEVACNFADAENGLIIEFRSITDNLEKYFSCSWLSKYSNESELLFIGQSITQTPLQICNIINSNGDEYYEGLIALNIINRMIKGILYKLENDTTRVRLKTIKLITKLLIKHQLSKTDNKYKKWESIPLYFNRLISIFCQTQTNIYIDWCSMHMNITNDSTKIGYSFLKNIICYKKYEWIKINVLKMLFPNMIQLHFGHIAAIGAIIKKRNNNSSLCQYGIQLSENVLLDILNFLDVNRSVCKVTIMINEQRTLFNIDEMIKKYKITFNKIGYIIKKETNFGQICVNTPYIRGKFNDVNNIKAVIIDKM